MPSDEQDRTNPADPADTGTGMAEPHRPPAPSGPARPSSPPTAPAAPAAPAASTSPTPPPAPDLTQRETGPAGSVGAPPHAADPGRPTPTGIDGFPVDSAETTPHRLPLRSLIGGVSPRALWGALPAFFILRDTGIGLLGVVVGIFLVGQLARLAAWSRFRWGFDGHVVRVSSGILWQQVRALDVERIQQVEVQRPLLHQVMGTAVLKVETASEGGEAEVRLDGLDNETATALQSAILTARRRERAAAGMPLAGPDTMAGPHTGLDAGTDPGADAPPTSILRPAVGDLVRSALTGSSLLVVPLSIAALGEFAFDVFGNDIDEVATEAARAGARLGYLTIAVVVLVIGAIGAVVTTLLRDWDIELVRRGDDLRLTRGLLTRHATTIPLHRLQVVQYRQNWLRRALGAGTLVVRSAGGGTPTSPNDAGSATMSIPWVTTDDLPHVLEATLDRSLRTSTDLPRTPQRHPPAARRRLAWKWGRGLGMLVVLTAVALFVLDVDGPVAWGAALSTAVVVIAGGTWLLSGTQYRRLGHASTSRVVLVTGGVLGSTQDWMPLERLQGVEGDATVFQRRLDLATVRLAPAGRGNSPVAITDVATATADDLGERFIMLAAGHAPVAATRIAGNDRSAGDSDQPRPTPPAATRGIEDLPPSMPSGPPLRSPHDIEPEHPDAP